MKYIRLEENQTLEDLVPGIGLVEGDTFEEFHQDLIQHNQNPYCKAIAIPADIDFNLFSKEDQFVYPTIEEHRAFSRFQICLWIYHDSEYTKPLYLYDASTFDELRMLSAFPNIEAIILPSTMAPSEIGILNAALFHMYDLEDLNV